METSGHVGKKIKDLRKSMNMTQQDLAKGIVSRGFISQLERGIVNASVEVLEKLANRLNCDIIYLFASSDQQTTSLLQEDLSSDLDSLESYIQEKKFSLANQLFKHFSIERTSKLNSYDKSRYLWIRAFLQWEDRQLDEAKKNVVKSIKFCTPLHEKLLGRPYNLLGMICYHLGELKESLNAFTKAMYFSTKYPADFCLRIETLLNLGVLHAHLKEYTSAIYFLLEADLINQRTDSLYKRGEIYMTLGVCYRNQGEWGNSENYYNKAISLFEMLEDEKLTAGVLTNLGVLYKIRKEFSVAKDFLTKATKKYTSLKAGNLLLNAQLELLEVIVNMNELRKANQILKDIEKASEITTKQKAALLLLKGKILYRITGNKDHDNRTNQGQCLHTQASECFLKAEEYLKSINDIAALKNFYKELGTLFYEYEKYEESATSYQRYFKN